MSTLISRNVTLSDRRTSIRLEPEMWEALNEICDRETRSVHEICAQIDRERTQSGLTAGVRVFILNYFRSAATEDGHAMVSHGGNSKAPTSQ
ncbi:ribbon-helix-helix domain-containing protein [Pelagibius litoralis]|uniref:ribbon-helix-helix domain-containing protein n=1 Tax=Pelagibius litoralis TaxID=374515 RepID=UPI002AC368ED|nr:ribbon-helix-helix domain-containing protein [Pelagibius litoralis]